ncbi:MAG: aldo/keto reductase, partial [Pseudomonadota bacterium]
MQTWDITLPSGVVMPAPGLGTWRMGERGSAAEAEIDALRHAYDAGFRHFDTAEMYGDGSAEEVLGQALAPLPRNQVFVTSKFYPHHARPGQMVGACEASLTRLGLDHLDLYLLHWPGSTPFEDTLEGARRLLDAGK